MVKVCTSFRPALIPRSANWRWNPAGVDGSRNSANALRAGGSRNRRPPGGDPPAAGPGWQRMGNAYEPPFTP